MMKLNKNIEYALMALKYLESKPQAHLVQVKEVCDLFSISFDVVSRIMQRLARAGVLKSVQGQRGGYFLVKRLDEINLYDLNMSLQGRRPVAKCLEEGFSCEHEDNCNIKESMTGLDHKVSAFYKGLSVSDCLQDGVST